MARIRKVSPSWNHSPVHTKSLREGEERSSPDGDSGPVAAMNQAFGVDLKRMSILAAHTAGAPGQSICQRNCYYVVEGVFELENRLRPSRIFVGGMGVRSRAAAVNLSYTPPQVAALYDFPTGLDGSGECIALIELGGAFNPTDLSNYWNRPN